MRKSYFLPLLLVVFITQTLTAQKPVLTPRPAADRHSLEEITNSIHLEAITPGDRINRYAETFYPRSMGAALRLSDERIERWIAQPNAQTGLPDWIQLWGEGLNEGTTEEQTLAWFTALSSSWGISKAEEELLMKNVVTEENGLTHVIWQQQFKGVPLYNNEIKAHFRSGRLYLLNGRITPSPELNTVPALAANEAVGIAKTAIERHTRIKHLDEQEMQFLGGEQLAQELTIFYADKAFNEPHLAWVITFVPNLASRWEVIIDAHSGEILREHDHVCHFLPPDGPIGLLPPDGPVRLLPPDGPARLVLSDGPVRLLPPDGPVRLLPPDGPEVTTATDLQGVSRTIHSYESGGQNFLIDASRPMFSSALSDIPNEPVGVIWTIDGNNTSPANDDFGATHIISAGNFWNDPLAVSAHYNAGEAYRYFLETFNRNSINGQGGNVASLINIVEEDGTDMDNAFWNGQAMFYGNGNAAFTSPLAKALDVAGHEISHGVVQNTANLEYRGESGALNESFADIFGAMIDRDDWQMGEEVVNPAVFPSGALRDLSNPNNGGNSLGDPGWQPAHTNEQYTGSQDNGGVHINSGIPNRAFFLFASDVGRAKAEQVYYRALNVYLTRSSQFLDLRAAVAQAAGDLYGQAEVDAAINAFNTVGIGSGGGGGTPTNTQTDLSVNPGDEYVLYTEGNNNNLYLQTPQGVTVADPLSSLNPLSKPSITDDGTLIVFVAEDKTIRTVDIDWGSGQAVDGSLSSDPIWRNVAISRDGNRLAALTDDNDNRLYVFDLASGGTGTVYFLTNPTYTEGVSTGDVQYADVLEWDHSGEFVMYDAYNIIPNQNGSNIDYWDIGFVKVWDRSTNDFGDGFISKLFSSLPENTSVGNPSFSKNSPYIIAMDFIDGNSGSYFLLGANIETGEVGELFENGRLNYPNYSNEDDLVIFDAEEDTFGDAIVAAIPVNDDKITPASNAYIFINNGILGARWGTWFANGQRVLVNTVDPGSEHAWAQVFPTVSGGDFTLAWELSSAATLHMEVYDMLGRRFQQEQWVSTNGQGQKELQLDLPSGSYLLHLRAGEQLFKQLIVVE